MRIRGPFRAKLDVGWADHHDPALGGSSRRRWRLRSAGVTLRPGEPVATPIGFGSSHVGLYGSDFSEGAMVGPYIVERFWHRGELATLYQARHEKTGALAALKVLHQQLSHSGKMLKRFEQESDALKRLHHPNIVEILESGELRDGRPFIATEWLEGQNLSEEIERRGSFSAREVVLVMQQIGAALS